MRNKDWAFAVEEATRRLLTSFVFNSKRDHQVFERLLRANQIFGTLPNAIFINFNVQPHDVTTNEPSVEWDTILRVIEVNDVVIRNVLIDMASVEGTILLKTDEDARRIMDGMCPDKCIRAFTSTGGMAMGRNRRNEGFYRFYACRGTPRAMFLIDQTVNVDIVLGIEALLYFHNFIVSMKSELQRLQCESSKMEEEIKKVSSEVDTSHRQFNNALCNYNAAESDLNNLRDQYRLLERKLEQLELDDDYSVIDNMRASLNEITAQIGEFSVKIRELNEVVLQKQKKLSELKVELEGMESISFKTREKIGILQDELESVNGKIRHLNITSELDKSRKERIHESIMKIEGHIGELEIKRIDATKTAEQSKELPKPSCMSIPPDMEQLSDTAELEEKYKALTLKISSAEKVQKLLECLAIRKEKFPIMCHAITMRLKMTFQRLMAIRSYHGTLTVDREKAVININVATHQRDQTSAEVTNVMQDLKGLSGGERSFTTACFIMALWEIMEAPFRCMDEFDVFMDMVNRRVVMDLLVKLATEQYSHNQFIFFTPQGIKELGEREHVQVFEMPKWTLLNGMFHMYCNDRWPFLLVLVNSVAMLESGWMYFFMIKTYLVNAYDEQTSKYDVAHGGPQFLMLEGVVASGSFSRYELNFSRPMRIVVESLEGDADIYFSYSNQAVSYELNKHDVSSATCGLDYIDVVSSSQPVYLGVGGLLVIIYKSTLCFLQQFNT
ncbi:hypothetical protein DICVIV_08460 [Dictyocaulus viviparus]|uniref:RecF/RecN/SMC protein n=1 Tax=Dictyocaulus viviparus TaxID=29172 RepID=A0A0D8XLH8_DICVI|nr:hypothetical protein DICVIV_08460 [Dictyocaulus viviparus]